MEIKFLADVNIEKKIVDCLIRFGFDVKWIPDFDCAMSDAALMALANREKRILLTKTRILASWSFCRKNSPEVLFCFG